MTVEIELKLAIPPATASQLRRHPLVKSLSSAPPLRRRLHNRYFDTADLDLTRQGYALRLRRVDGRWLQTLKGGGQMEGGLHRREEWEVSVDGDALDLSRFRNSAAQQVLAPLAGQLQLLFVTDFWRTTWELTTAAGDRIELALDQGEIRAGGKQVTISEVELELKAGNPLSLYQVAVALQQDLPLRPESANKAERGYALYLGLLPAPVKAEPLALSPAMDAASALQAIAWNCMAQLQRNECGLLHLSDPEYLHQMRVGLRRLRAALGLIQLAKTDIMDKPILRELGWLAERLGPARDWDVFVTQTLPLLTQKHNFPSAALISHAAETTRKRRLVSARRAVASARYAGLLLRLSLWVAQAKWRTGGMFDKPAIDFARQTLQHHQRQTRKRGKSTDKPEDLHALRIAVKKLRYAVEFFASLFDAGASRGYGERLTELQDILGRLNDLTVASRLLSELAGGADRQLQQALDSAQGRLEKLSKQDVKALRKAWRKFSDGGLFWKKC
jgi:triphosphatase